MYICYKFLAIDCIIHYSAASSACNSMGTCTTDATPARTLHLCLKRTCSSGRPDDQRRWRRFGCQPESWRTCGGQALANQRYWRVSTVRLDLTNASYAQSREPYNTKIAIILIFNEFFALCLIIARGKQMDVRRPPIHRVAVTHSP